MDICTYKNNTNNNRIFYQPVSRPDLRPSVEKGLRNEIQKSFQRMNRSQASFSTELILKDILRASGIEDSISNGIHNPPNTPSGNIKFQFEHPKARRSLQSSTSNTLEDACVSPDTLENLHSMLYIALESTKPSFFSESKCDGVLNSPTSIYEDELSLMHADDVWFDYSSSPDPLPVPPNTPHDAFTFTSSRKKRTSSIEFLTNDRIPYGLMEMELDE